MLDYIKLRWRLHVNTLLVKLERLDFENYKMLEARVNHELQKKNFKKEQAKPDNTVKQDDKGRK